MDDSRLRLRVWQDGAFSASVTAPEDDRYTLVAGDGRTAVRVVAVDRSAWSDTSTVVAGWPGGIARASVRVASEDGMSAGRVAETALPSGALARTETLAGEKTTVQTRTLHRADGAAEVWHTDESGTTVQVFDASGNAVTSGRLGPPIPPGHGSVTSFEDGGGIVVTDTPDGSVTERYDANGNVTARTELHEQQEISGASSTRWETERYDSAGQVTEREQANSERREDGTWSANLYTEDAAGTHVNTHYDGNDTGASYTSEASFADGTSVTQHATAASDGSSTKVTEFYDGDDKATGRISESADGQGNQSTTEVRYTGDGGADVKTTSKGADGTVTEHEQHVDDQGNPVDRPAGTGGDGTTLPTNDYSDFAGPDHPGWYPWEMLTDDSLSDVFGELGARSGVTDLQSRIGELGSRLRAAVTGGGPAAEANASGVVLDVTLDAVTARTANSSLDLADPGSVTAFVTDLARAATGLSRGAPLIGP
jgi:hypothetical protein